MKENSVAPPSQVDYEKAKKVAILETLQSAPVLVVTGGGILGAAACGLLAITSPLVAGAVAAGGIIGGGALWLMDLARNGDKIQAAYRESLHKQANEFRLKRLGELEVALSSFDCPQGSSQVREFGEKFDTLVAILGKKLSNQELTYSRFVSNAELICSSGIKNLERVVDYNKSLSTIDSADQKRKIARLERVTTPTAADKRTLETLRTSQKIYEETQEKIANLLAQNEESLTVLEQAAVGAADIRSDSITEMEFAMKQLLDIARRQVTPTKEESLL
jgi:hypothetical protein